MKRARHALGRWLLRDAPPVTHHVAIQQVGSTVQVYMDGKAIQAELLKFKRRNGGGSLGLS